jgi:uncharacterized small protein (DUF1192 family)
MAKPEEVKHRFIELRALGKSYAAICKELQITKRTAVDWGRQLEQEIARLKAIELEGLYESYGLQKEARIKALGGMLQRMEAELAQRDLTKVNTGRLLELYLTYHQQAALDAQDLRFISTQEEEEEHQHQEILKALATL